MKVLVGYASAHGSTEGIAKEIGARLTLTGVQAEVRPIDEIEEIDTFDAVVLGSAIHNMTWLPQATALVQRRAADLAVRPVWLFSVSSVGETNSFFGSTVAGLMRRMHSEPKNIASFRQAIHPRGHRAFSGAVEPTHWNLAGNLFLRAFGGSFGDHRDWPDIDAWADTIARELLAAE